MRIAYCGDRIEIESPGLFVGQVTVSNIERIGTYARNSLIVNNLREFPSPPNLDAGEGVRMMFGTMRSANLYPPIYMSRQQTGRDSVVVVLRNQNMPSAWEQVSHFVDEHGTLSNRHVKEILRTDDTLKASKMLKEWVDKGLLVVANPEAGTRVRKYAKPERSPVQEMFASLLGTRNGTER